MYQLPNADYWKGRIDREGYFCKRFHEVIKLKHINNLANAENAIGLIGFECDEGVKRNKGRIGARYAPNEIRKALSNIPYNFGQNVPAIDVGNITCQNGNLESAQEELGRYVNLLLRHSCTPIILGGGHETLYGHYIGIRRYLGAQSSLGIINIDAHFDLRNETIPSSGTMFRQILEKDSLTGYFCIGIQPFGNTQALFETAKAFNCNYILAEDVEANGFQQTYQSIDTFIKRFDHIIVTLCTDSLSASAAPGVSSPSPLGLDPKTVIKLLRHIMPNEKVLSFDISEVNPLVDENKKTIKLASYILAEVMKCFVNKTNLAVKKIF